MNEDGPPRGRQAADDAEGYLSGRGSSRRDRFAGPRIVMDEAGNIGTSGTLTKTAKKRQQSPLEGIPGEPALAVIYIGGVAVYWTGRAAFWLLRLMARGGAHSYGTWKTVRPEQRLAKHLRLPRLPKADPVKKNSSDDWEHRGEGSRIKRTDWD